MEHILAHKGGINLVLLILHLQGAVCPECGHGTRRTSKRWAKCKSCGRMKIRRRTREEVKAILDEMREGASRPVGDLAEHEHESGAVEPPPASTT